MSLPSRLLGANPSIQVSTLLSGSLTTPSAKGAFSEGSFFAIQSEVLGSTSSTISFTSIPSTYTHLQLRSWASSSTQNADIFVRFNEDASSSNYDTIYWGSNGSNTPGGANSATPGAYYGLNATESGYPWVGVMDIQDYTNTSNHKNLIANSGSDRNNVSTGTIYHHGSRWKNTVAINRIDIVIISASFSVGSIFALYGMK